jgi:fucose permease
VFLAIGLIVALRRRDWVNQSRAVDPRLPATRAVLTDYRRALALLIGLLFVGAGLEATAGDWSYTQLTAGRSLSAGLASLGVSLFWAGLAGGRVALGLLGNRATPVRLLDISIGVATLAALAFWLAPPLVSALIALPILGAAVSLIFPLLLSITPSRVGAAMTSHAVGYELAAGVLGGGGLPALAGPVLQTAGLSSLGPLLFAMAAGLTLLHVSSRVGGGRRSRRRGRDPRAS